MTEAEIGKARRIVEADRNVAGHVGHEVVQAGVPAQIELRHEVGAACDLVGLAAADRETRPAQAEITRQRRVDGGPRASEWHQHQHRRLSAQYRRRERVAWNREGEIRLGVEVGGEVAGEIYRKVTARDLARERHVAAGLDRGVIADFREREARHQRGRGEAAEEARHPEAHAAFIGAGDRRCDDDAERQRSGDSVSRH